MQQSASPSAVEADEWLDGPGSRLGNPGSNHKQKRNQICLPILLIKKRAFSRGVEGVEQRVGVGKERGYGAESTVYSARTA